MRVPCARFVGVNFCPSGDLAANEIERFAFRLEHAGQRHAVSFADHHDALPLA
jgi:hypothetical protein